MSLTPWQPPGALVPTGNLPIPWGGGYYGGGYTGGGPNIGSYVPSGGGGIGLPPGAAPSSGGMPQYLAGQLGPASSAPLNDAAATATQPLQGFVPPIASAAANAAPPAATGYLAGVAGGGSWLGSSIAGALPTEGILGKLAGVYAGPAGPAITGIGIAKGINALIPTTTGTAGNIREAASDAAVGAGLGGSVGALLAPATGGLSLPIGAGVGAAAGLGYGLLQDFGILGSGSDDTKKLKDTIGSSAQQLGVSADEYKARFDLMYQTGAKDAEGNKMSASDIAAHLGDQMLNDVETTRAQKEASANQLALHQADLNSNLALQSQAQQFMQPYTNSIVASGVSQAKVLNSLADQMPAAYKGVFQTQAANVLNTSQQMAGAYAAEAQLQPTMQILNTYQTQQNQQLSDQAKLFQYAAQMKAMGAGGGTAAPGGLSQLIQPGSAVPGAPPGY